MLTNLPSNPIRPISASSTSQNLITLNTLNPYSDLNDDCENETDSFDNVNKMDFFDDENKMNFDVIRINQLEKNNINIAESSSVENITLSQEFIELATNRSSYYKSNKLPLMQPDNLPMDNFDQNEFDSNSDQSKHDSNSNQSEDNDSEQSEHDINQDIDEEFDIDEETDKDCDRIMPSSSLLSIDNSDIFPESSYNPVRFLYNPPLLKENYVTQWIVLCQVLAFLDAVRFQNFSSSQHYIEKIIAQPKSIIKYIVCLHCHSLYLPTDLPLKTSEHTKCLTFEDGVLGNIYDEKIWKEFLDEEGHPFFVEDNADIRIGLALNVDWYTPYSYVKRSCAPIYMTILNFPRHIRYRNENLILVGIIPGPKEPNTKQLQNYLQPMVNELKQLWSSQIFKTTQYPIRRMFRCALVQIACDIPAARTSKLDYSNYSQEDSLLTNAEHRRIALQYKIGDSTTQKKLFQQHGIRWTCLLELPYIDIPRFTTIDPMHNIFLGTSKHIVQHAWMNGDLPKLSIKHLYEIQNLIDATPLPIDLDRINLKITSGFDTLTADQWKI
ncbi:10212_t:CDS:2 [Cetraspora pellucida]|uniref:10212_t:CDS:1 n=1 Tax=Cetraspora pellucida TaxID=1433469 RepID=A0ACA9M9U4_9GLOM|nr:10212_t:CDS:2 [Cetraspora pellucida]